MYINFSMGVNLSKFMHDWFEDLRSQLEDEIYEMMLERADEITEWMQMNASWEDQTGAARASLEAEVTDFYNGILEITLSYNDPDIFYSVYLETMQGGRFEILGPAMDYWGPILARDISRIVNS